MRLDKGIQLLHEVPGDGTMAVDGATVVFNARFFLRRGEEVTNDHEILSRPGNIVPARIIGGVELIDHVTELGRRHSLTGVELSLRGMRVHGYREVLVAPRLAYGRSGVPNRIPANAMLRIQLWLQDVRMTC